MFIRISHETRFTFESTARSLIQVMRLTPRNDEGQRVLNWRVDVTPDCELVAAEDAFGNITHTFSIEGPVSELLLVVEGEVQTFDTAGVVRGAVERFPPELYLRSTPLTMPEDVLRTFAKTSVNGQGDRLPLLHTLMQAVHDRMQPDPASKHDIGSTAAEALATSKGSARDVAHVFVTCARALDIPSRFVTGYLQEDGGREQDCEHAWAEAHADGLGWVGFDAVHNSCPTEAYIRVACGLDALGAAPIRLASSPPVPQTHRTHLKVLAAQASRQAQS